MRELLSEIRQRGYQLALATASKDEALKHVLDRAGLDLDPRVDAIVNAGDVEESKPAPDTIQAALDKLGVGPENAVLIGDTPYDAQAASRAGVPFVGVETGGHSAARLREAGAVVVYPSVSEVLAHLGDVERTFMGVE